MFDWSSEGKDFHDGSAFHECANAGESAMVASPVFWLGCFFSAFVGCSESIVQKLGVVGNGGARTWWHVEVEVEGGKKTYQ